MTTTATRRRSLATVAGISAGLATVLTPAAAHAAPAAAPTAPSAAQSAIAADDVVVVSRSNPNPEIEVGQPFVVQGGCDDVFSPTAMNNGRPAAKAHWELTCGGGNIVMEGWVDDVLADGLCAYVRGEFSDHTDRAKNCPEDSPRTEFKFVGPGNHVDGYVYVG